jgi:flagellar biogenesis protein FliO
MTMQTILTTCSRGRAISTLLVRWCGAIIVSVLLATVLQAAPPAPLPAASGRDAKAPSTVLQASRETPIVQPGGVASPLNPNAGKSVSAAKTPIRGGVSTSQSTGGAASPGTAGAGSSLIGVMASLAVVIGLLVLVLWVMRRALPGGTRKLPTEVLDVLGYAPLGNRQQMQLLRLGNKLLLVSVTATGAETLTEVTDPDEVEHLTKLSRQPATATPAASFRQLLDQFTPKPTSVASSANRPAPAVPGIVNKQERARG